MNREQKEMVKDLKVYYQDVIVKQLMKEFSYKNVMEVPKILKITLNMGVGAAVADKKVLGHAVDDMEKIAGQKPVITMTKKSIAGFKIRSGWPIGCKVTLRSQKMYDFIERFISINLPRTRDFHGLLESSFDGSGNYSFGVREQIVFYEIDYNSIDKIRGLDVCISTSAKTDKEALALLKALGFPFRQKGKMYA